MRYETGYLSSFALVREGLRVYRDHFLLFMKLAVVLALPPCLVGAAVAPALAGSVGAGPGESLASSLALSACSTLAQTLLGVGVCCALVDVFAGDEVSLRGVWPRLRRKIGPMFALLLLTNVLILLGLVALVVPGIVMSLNWAFASQVVVFEDVRPWPALARSRQLVYGHRGRIAVLGLMTGLVLAPIGVGLPKLIALSVGNMPFFSALLPLLPLVVLGPIAPCVMTLAYLGVREAQRPAGQLAM